MSSSHRSESEETAGNATRLQFHPWYTERGCLEIDTAVVGAGPAGLYSALRLAEQFPASKICLFESMLTCGGRVLTLRPSALPFAADVGAMRFLPHQALISSLGEQFNLKTYNHDFATWSYFVRGRDIRAKRFFPEKDALQERPLKVVAGEPSSFDQSAYRDLDVEETGLEPSGLTVLGIARVLGQCSLSGLYRKDKDLVRKAGQHNVVSSSIETASKKGSKIRYSDLDPYKWRAFKLYAEFEAKPLYQLSFWDVIQKNLTAEAFKFIEDGLGYQTIIGTWNAAEAIPWFLADFSGSKYRSFDGGMSELIDKMLAQFFEHSRRNHQQKVEEDQLCFLGWKLEGVQRQQATSSDHIFNMQFAETQFEDIPDVDSQGNPCKRQVRKFVPQRVRAKNIVFAMSRGALEQLNLDGFLFNEYDSSEDALKSFRRSIQCVASHPLLKTFMWFQTPWWFDHSKEKEFLSRTEFAVPKESKSPQGGGKDEPNRPGTLEFATGRIFTDLPLRMIYYHGPSSDSCTVQGSDSRMAMIMAYCDARHAEYWESLNSLDEARWLSEEFADIFSRESPEDNTIMEFGVSETFAERMHDQLWRFHRHNTELETPEKSVFAVFMNWAKEPYFGGWHTWKIGYNAASLQPKLMAPFIDSRLFICGEAFSADQGWIEGALKSAELMLTRHLDVPQAEWKGLKEAVLASGYKSIDDYCQM